MKIKTKSLPGSRISVELEIPAERCQNSYEEALSRLSRSIKLPGFRQGKVPRAVILQQIGVARIKATALEALLESVWREALTEKSIEPLSEPELKDSFETLLSSFDPSQNLNVTLETDIDPTPSLKTTKGLEVKAEIVKFDPSRVDELIEQSRKQLATLVPIEGRPAAKGDLAVVSFKGSYEDGTEIEGGSSESMDIELEQGQMIPGFIEGIIGMKVNEEKTLKCEFPKDYSQEDARGKKANFIVNLKELKNRELPSLDDEFAKQASDKTTMSELREDLENRLKEDAKKRQENNKKEALIKALVSQLEVEIPQSLVDQEVRILVEQTAQKFAQQGMDVKSMFTPELVKSLMESSKDEAKESLKRKLALKALATAEGIKVDEKAVEEKFQEISQELSNEGKIDPNRLREAIREDLSEDLLLKWLEENNKVIEVQPKQDPKKKESTSTTKTKKEKGATKKPKS